MLVIGSIFDNTPVMSLQTGAQLAKITKAMIDPRNLTVVAFEVDGPLLTDTPTFLRVDDIRDVAPMGIIIDSADEMVGLNDVIKLKKLYNLGFSLIGLPVIDEHKRKLGKVENFTLETGGFVIQQLSVKRGLIRGLTDTGLLIHRSQIVEITDTEIIVKGTGQDKKVDPVTEQIRHEYINPFRRPSVQPEQIEG